MRQEGVEPAASFEQAWLDNDRRQAENWRPPYSHQHRSFYAREIAGKIEHFPPQQFLVLFYEDWYGKPYDVLPGVWHHRGIPEISNPKITREILSSGAPASSSNHPFCLGDQLLEAGEAATTNCSLRYDPEPAPVG